MSSGVRSPSGTGSDGGFGSFDRQVGHGHWRVGLVDADSETERHAVAALRQQAYAGAREFIWHDLATLGWTDSDDRSAVLGLWQRGENGTNETLLSTVRATVFSQLAAAEAFLEHALDGVNAQGPALVLGARPPRPVNMAAACWRCCA